SPGPITFSSIYGGEDYDARLNPKGWDLAGFDDSGWPHAVEIVRPPGRLRGHSVAADPFRGIEGRQAKSLCTLTNCGKGYDFGQEASYMITLRVTGPAGSTVRLTPAEILGDDGAINQSTMGAGKRGSSWWEYTKCTDGEELWSPQFWYIGCRYVQALCTGV